MDNGEKKSNKAEEMRIKLVYGTLTLLVCSTAAAGFFYGGYRLGIESTAATIAVPQNYADVPTEASSSPQPTPKRMNYTVVSENGRICLYENNMDGQRLIASEPISIEMFPPSDRAELENGANFDDLTSAQALFEDFSN